ncbi:nucleotide-diphospho-sugar transferases [Lucifera butyrica]|uniref:Nucleotide-diphospho-sugar transferases n=1 Tax=Lucifera butyrica TaxID=1351585 RepID=A0A498R4Z5_9FIRM|nr:glycosyltransferase family 2 protein [Lucifera butyrica]VBB05332.1 nucleotide-diphospho-sugar transferases [Lucifera butyrica]
MHPLVSIIICTYNRSNCLDQLLSGLAQLSYPNYEIIVVDNNSTDCTYEICQKYDLIYLKEPRQGSSYARNRGVEKSSGKYLLFLDDDTVIIHSSLIEKMLQGFKLTDHVGAVGAQIISRFAGTNPNIYADLCLPYNGQDFGRNKIITDHTENLMGACIMYSRRAVGRIRFAPALGRKGKNLLGKEELQLNDRIRQKGYWLVYIHDAKILHEICETRSTFEFASKLYFSEGMSEYLAAPPLIIFRKIHKAAFLSLLMLFSLCSLNQKHTVNSYMKLCHCLGIMYGPIFRITNKYISV